MTEDDKTVILTGRKPAAALEEKPAAIAEPPKPPRAAPPAVKTEEPREPGLSGGVIMLFALALVLVGISTALLTVYLATPQTDSSIAGASSDQQFSQAELDAEIAPVADESTEAADQALIESVVSPGLIELSGDPVVVRQVQGKARQLVKLEQEAAVSASRELGAKGPVFRLTDMLDTPNSVLNGGVLGSQDGFAMFQNTAFQPPEGSTGPDDDEGTSVLPTANAGAGPQRREFAKEITGTATIAAAIESFGLDPEWSARAGEAFAALYGVKKIQKQDAIAVVAERSEDAPGIFIPMQVSLYREDALLATVAMSDLGSFTKGEDPWYQKDIFAAQLLPDTTETGEKQRLLDAIYAVALRNGLPPAVAGETIMMMSRAHDLEQPVAVGDSIAIVYSTAARDPKTGFGRVIYVRVARSAGNLECYVFQATPGGPYQCVSQEGASSLAQSGIIMPVSGTVVAKFGPQGAEGDDGEKMNFGVDIAAAKGTPVVAAAAGTVTSAGNEPGLGNVVRMSHDDGSETAYAYLQKFATGITQGSKLNAGDTLGYVGTPPSSREPRLHFELRRNGEPVDPVGEIQQSVGGGSAVDVFVGRIIHIESANNCKARNPLSTAVGLGQFIESTWMTTVRLHRPDLLQGRSRSQVLDLRLNCELSKAMTTAFTRDNAAVLRSRGHPITPGNLYLAHFLGVGGAVKALSAGSGRQVAEVFGGKMVNANPFMRGKNISYLVNWAAKKMSGRVPKRVASAAQGRAPAEPPKGAVATKDASALQPDRKTGAPVKDKAGKAGPKDGANAKEFKDGATAETAGDAGSSDPAAELTKYAGDPQFAAMKRNVDILMH
jgi:murein DD-endopeptidase MepM/ murein hydrolase activator NlpD